MIERKTQKLSKNSRENTSKKHIGKESFISSLTNQREKSAAETAGSILEELGVKQTSKIKSEKNKILNNPRKDERESSRSIELHDTGKSILNDLKKEKINISSKIPVSKTKNKEKYSEKFKDPWEKKSQIKSNLQMNRFRFHEKFILFILCIIFGISILGYVGGYIKFDLKVFREILNRNYKQLEFVGEFRARQVENGYNRIPLFVVEGTIRNSFFKSDNVEKIRLKAFAFDHEQRLIDSHFTYTGMILSDEQLETLSPINIKALRQTADLSILEDHDFIPFQGENLGKNLIEKMDTPFQVIFFKDVATIKSAAIEIVSYVRNENLVFLASSNSD